MEKILLNFLKSLVENTLVISILKEKVIIETEKFSEALKKEQFGVLKEFLR